MLSGSDHCGVLLHQGIGLEAFNEMPKRKAVHALYECCNSVTMASDLADGRPYPDRTALFRNADAVLFSLSEDSVDEILQAYPKLGSRPGSTWSHAEQSSVWDPHTELMAELDAAARAYATQFGFDFVMYLGSYEGDCPFSAVIAAIGDRMHHDVETERKVLRNEIAKLNRSRLERMLGPVGGYDNWA